MSKYEHSGNLFEDLKEWLDCQFISDIKSEEFQNEACLADYSGPLAHPGRSLAQLDRASAHSTRSAVQPMLAADQHTC